VIGRRALVAVALLTLPACGHSTARSSTPPKPTTTTTSYSQEATSEVTTEHFRCVVYQPGGPNSGRLWCDHGEPGEGGAP
jgi:hypothetical protein